jgi:hypothetical protein
LRLGGTPHLRAQEWRWPRGGKIKFSHLQLATTVYEARSDHAPMSRRI